MTVNLEQALLFDVCGIVLVTYTCTEDGQVEGRGYRREFGAYDKLLER